MHRHVWLNRIIMFTDHVTADRSSTMTSELCTAIISVKVDNDPKHTAKSLSEANKFDILQRPSQSPDFNPPKHDFLVLK